MYDRTRDARSYKGPHPVVCHPPCRLWGRMRGLSTADASEMSLAIHAVETLLEWGGVLEHPADTRLLHWVDLIPSIRKVAIRQKDFGHQAVKPTLLLVVGSDPCQWPDMPLDLSPVTHVIGSSARSALPEVSKAWRERTPPKLARWMVAVARLATMNKYQRSNREN